MEAEQARLLQIGAAYIGAIVREDEVGLQLMNDDLQAEARSPEAVLFVAVVAASTWCLASGLPDNAVSVLWPTLPPPVAPWDEHADRRAVTNLATALRAGTSDEISLAQASLKDKGVFLISAIDLALATINALAAATGVTAATWCQKWAEASAGGIGVG